MSVEPKIVFIGGVGRSGTSVTREILGRHSDVATLPFEYRFIIDPDGILDFLFGHKDMWSPYLFDTKLRRLEALLCKLGSKKTNEALWAGLLRRIPFLGARLTRPQYLNWELNKHLPGFLSESERLLSELRLFTFRGQWVGSPSYQLDATINYVSPDRDKLFQYCQGFCQRVLNNWLSDTRTSVVVEDNTWNLLYADKLAQLFPNARFVHVQRDPRDVVLSFMEQSWMPDDMLQASQVCADLYRQVHMQIGALDPKQVLTISLENLVDDHNAVVDKLHAFCGLSGAADSLRTKMKASVIGRWNVAFSEEQKAQLNNQLATLLCELGYQ